MKKIFALILCVVMTTAISSCSGSKEKIDISNIPRLSPETLITAELASSMTGSSLVMSADGVCEDGNGLSVKYLSNPLGVADPVYVKIEQFSEKLPVAQVWSDYESDRIPRADMEFIDGVGEDCYIAYPFINVYVRGCYLRISAGSGNGENQKNALISLATNAAVTIEQLISAEAVNATTENVIK